MEMVAHLQVFPLPSGNTERSKERKKKRGQEKRHPLSQPPSAQDKRCPHHHLHLFNICNLGAGPDP